MNTSRGGCGKELQQTVQAGNFFWVCHTAFDSKPMVTGQRHEFTGEPRYYFLTLQMSHIHDGEPVL